MNKIKTLEDVVSYLEADVESTREAIKLGEHQGGKVSDSMGTGANLIIEYIEKVLLPILRDGKMTGHKQFDE